MRKERVYYIKPFTKAWWFNIWYQYKWQIIAGVFVFAIVLGFAVEKLTQVHYDFSILYVGDTVDQTKDEMAPLREKLNKVVPDTTGNGKYDTDCRSIFVSNELYYSDETIKTNWEQFKIEITSGETLVVLFSDGYESVYAKEDAKDEFCDLSYLAEKYGYAEEDLKRFSDGKVYGIHMKGNPLLGFDAEGVYLVEFVPISDEEKEVKRGETADVMTEYIISRGEYEVLR